MPFGSGVKGPIGRSLRKALTGVLGREGIRTETGVMGLEGTLTTLTRSGTLNCQVANHQLAYRSYRPNACRLTPPCRSLRALGASPLQ